MWKKQRSQALTKDKSHDKTLPNEALNRIAAMAGHSRLAQCWALTRPTLNLIGG